jgi:hypothetical protein
LPAATFSNKFKQDLERGFNIESVKRCEGNTLSYTINQTMMRIKFRLALKPGDKFSFGIK